MKDYSLIIIVCMSEETRDFQRGVFVNLDATLDRENTEVIVFNNGSVGDIEFLKGYAHKYAESSQKLNDSDALAMAATQATCSYIVVMPSDIKHEHRGWVNKLRDKCDENFGRKITDDDGCWIISRELIND